MLIYFGLILIKTEEFDGKDKFRQYQKHFDTAYSIVGMLYNLVFNKKLQPY